MLNPVYDLLSVLCDPYHVESMMEDDESNKQEMCYKNQTRRLSYVRTTSNRSRRS